MSASPLASDPTSTEIEAFIARWSRREGGQERANYALFLIGLTRLLGLPRAGPGRAPRTRTTTTSSSARSPNAGTTRRRRGRIDLYKRGCFVLEAKQSRLKGATKEIAGQADLLPARGRGAGRGGAARPRLGRADAERQAPGGGLCPRAARLAWLAALHPRLRRRPRASRSSPTSPARGRTTRSFPTGRATASASTTCATPPCASGCGRSGSTRSRSTRRRRRGAATRDIAARLAAVSQPAGDAAGTTRRRSRIS